MPRAKTIRIGIIGTGGMAEHHGRGYAKIPGVEMVACCDVDRTAAEAFAARFHIPAVYTDYEKMLREAGLDAVDNITPDALHAPIAFAAAEHGLHILSEKPLATSVEEGEAMLAAVAKAGVINMVNFTYRNAAALQAGHAVVAEGRLGPLRHLECSYLQSWLVAKYWGDWRREPRWLWRLSRAHGSGGTLGDIGCHLFDAVRFLAGPFSRLHCGLRTFQKEEIDPALGDYQFDANDSMIATVDFTHGAFGVMHATRWASGFKNTLKFRLHGELGAIEIDLDRAHTAYRACWGDDLDEGRWQTIEAVPTPDNYERFITAIRTGQAPQSSFATALAVQRYMELSEQSDANGRWVDVPADQT